MVGPYACRLLAREQLFGLIQRQVRALNVCRMVRLEHERPLLHSGDPRVGKPGGIEKAAGTLDSGQIVRNRVVDSKFWSQRHSDLPTAG